jgi:hypothetical protein
VDADETTQQEILDAFKEKKMAITVKMEEALSNASSSFSEAEQNAGEDNAAMDPDNHNVTHLSLGFGFGRGGYGPW